MNKLFSPAIGLYAILLLMFGLTSLGRLSFGLFIIIISILVATGLVISISKINKITKSGNTFKAKVYFSFIFSFLIFYLIIFFLAIGANTRGEVGLALTIGTVLFSSVGFLASFISGIILSIKRKGISEYDSEIKFISFFSTISIIVILILSFYNHLVIVASQVSKIENLCYLTLNISNNSGLFNGSYKDTCFINTAMAKLDVSPCDKVKTMRHKTKCYINVATAKNDTSICRKGADDGVEGMDSCLSIAIEKTDVVSPEDLVSAVQICESGGNCYSISDMENLLFNILNNPNDKDLTYAIKATKYIGKEKQITRAIPLLKKLLTSASLENRKIAMDSLLYMTMRMDLETEQQELKQVLTLIEKQSELNNYTEQVKRRLSARLVTPVQTQTPTPPR